MNDNQPLLYRLEQNKVPKLLEALTNEFRAVLDSLGIAHYQNGHSSYLLVWLQLSRRYGVPFGDVVRMTVERYRGILKKTGASLGLSLAALTGPKAVAWLREELGKIGPAESQAGFRPVAQLTSPEAYIEAAIKARKASRKIPQHPYRGSKRWVAPAPDIVRKRLRL